MPAVTAAASFESTMPKTTLPSNTPEITALAIAEATRWRRGRLAGRLRALSVLVLGVTMAVRSVVMAWLLSKW